MLGIRRTIRLVKLRNRGDELLELAEDAEADPRLYRDPTWQQRVIDKLADLALLIPLPPAIHEGIRPVGNFLKGATTNWKTTLIGIAAAFGYAFLAAMQGGMKPKDAAIAAGIGLLGAAAGDHSQPDPVTATDQPPAK